MAIKTLADSMAILDNLLDGTALPKHLARHAASMVTTSSRVHAPTVAEQSRAWNAEQAKIIAAKLDVQPLQATCYNHQCQCGNKWQSFGFYSRKVTHSALGVAAVTVIKQVEHVATEKPQSTEWLPKLESHCIQCYAPAEGGARYAAPVSPEVAAITEKVEVETGAGDWDWRRYVLPIAYGQKLAEAQYADNPKQDLAAMSVAIPDSTLALTCRSPGNVDASASGMSGCIVTEEATVNGQ
jgi:hypothetical protein